MAARELAGQAAFVTGGGAGIGRGIALALAGAGADVAIADVVPERCAEVAERIAELGGRALACPLDVTDGEVLRAAIARAAAHFGRLDVLVNNAGGVSRRAFAEQSERSWRKHLELNLLSLFTATSAAIPAIIAGGRGGAIVNVSSVAAERPVVFDSIDYDSAKAGVNAITRAAAAEFAQYGIRVNAVMPGATNRPGAPPLGGARPTGPFTMPGRMPMQRIAEPIEQARAVLFLASPAASYISGVCLPVDGAGLLS
jgi:NAD(P)-dependent dehydrogenase (short-subunit alcohol dehydrogenase family)